MALSTQQIADNYTQYRETLAPYISQELMDYIDESDFRSAPASTRDSHHSAYEGGLTEHSLGVLRYLRILNRLVREIYTPEQITRVALLHDICKIGCYHKEEAWRKDSHGKWEAYARWRFEDPFPAGHGSKSVAAILSHGTKLTDDEILAITHHMGAYNLQGPALMTYQEASKKCPLVLLTGWADLFEANIEPYMIGRKQSEQIKGRESGE